MEDDIHRVNNEDGTVDSYAFISKDSSNGISMTAAKALQTEIMQNLVEINDFSKSVNQAARLFTSSAFKEAAEVYIWLSVKYPQQKALCLGQVGAALYFMGEYPKAVAYYKQAYQLGDTDMQEENIFESAEAQYKEHNDSSLLREYLGFFPEGKFVNAALDYLKS